MIRRLINIILICIIHTVYGQGGRCLITCPYSTLNYCTTATQSKHGTSQTSSQSARYGNSGGGATSTSSSRLPLSGIYHYYYSAGCNGGTAGSGTGAVLVCQTDVNTNGATGAGVTSGYDTTNNRYYPPEPGRYLVVATALGCYIAADIVSYSQILWQIGGSPGIASLAYMSACSGVASSFQSIGTSAAITFNSVGSGNYIYLYGGNLLNGGSDYDYNRLNIMRVA